MIESIEGPTSIAINSKGEIIVANKKGDISSFDHKGIDFGALKCHYQGLYQV